MSRWVSRRRLPGLACVLLMALGSSGVFANENDSSEAQIRALEQRVADLEAQNRAMLELLQEIRSRLPAEEVSAAAAPAGPAGKSGASEEKYPAKVQLGNSSLGFYGFVRLDAIYDDSRSSAIQTPTFILSEDSSLGTGDSEASFNFHPRLTRFGMNFDGPEIGERGVKLSGKIEIDFQNGGRESRSIIRMRHAYMNLDWGKTSLLIGQTWDLFSPLYPTVNSDTLMWNAGNLGDRRPQVRFQAKSNKGLTFAAGVGLTGAIDSQDLDGDGVRDGDDAEIPHVQARLGYAGESFSVGLSGHTGREEVRSAVAGETSFDTSSVSLDFQGTAGLATVKGEIWTGENLSDFRGGIGQGINTATGQEIESSGGWLELGLELSELYSLYVGYSIDDPTDDDILPGGRIKNDAWYLVNRFRVGRPFMVGFDYLYWTTEFKGLDDGTDNRFNLYVVYTF